MTGRGFMFVYIFGFLCLLRVLRNKLAPLSVIMLSIELFSFQILIALFNSLDKEDTNDNLRILRGAAHRILYFDYSLLDDGAIDIIAEDSSFSYGTFNLLCPPIFA